MNKIPALVILVLMIASFQNCGKVQQSDISSTDQSAKDKAQTQYNKFSIDGYNILSIWDYKRLQYLDIDLKTGIIKVFAEAGQVPGPSMQLNSDELALVKSILNQGEVCEPVVQLPAEGQVCSMLYRYPYAILVDKGDEIRLGEMTSGCDVPVDLCEQKSSQLRDWSSRIVEHLLDGTVAK
jgi:hypothetical protein